MGIYIISITNQMERYILDVLSREVMDAVLQQKYWILETAVLFASDQMITKLNEAETVHFDATFKVVPRIFYQLLTVFIRYKAM